MWRTYQSAGPDQSRRALRLPGHRGGSSCLRRWSLGLNEGWSLRTHTHTHTELSDLFFLYAGVAGLWMNTKVINVCNNVSVRKINRGYWPDWMGTFFCCWKKMTIWMLQAKYKVSCLFHFPNMDFSHCRIITSKLHWAVINRQLFSTAVVWNETTLKCFHANVDQLFEIMGPKGGNINNRTIQKLLIWKFPVHNL